MDDRELLELAAKANGFHVKGWVGDRIVFFNPVTGSAEDTWNPLSSDGDALRLAIKLRLDLTFYNGFQEVHAEPSNGDGLSQSIEGYGDDIGHAARRAIVRAAAEIGESI